MNKTILIIFLFFIIPFGCKNTNKTQILNDTIANQTAQIYIKKVKLSTNLKVFNEKEKQIIKLLMHVADYADSMFFYENFENYRIVLDTLKDSTLREKFIYNFGPWERFNSNKPFISGVGPKFEGANFYPSDMTRMEFLQFEDSFKFSPHTFIRRDKDGNLYCIPYHIKFKKYIDSIEVSLKKVAELSDDPKFSEFLLQRIKDLRNDEYYLSDSMWINLGSNTIDFIIGPVYVYEDRFLNLKAEHQSYVLIRDIDWTLRVGKYNKWLKFLQKTLPVPVEYRAEDPGSSSNIVVYDAIYYGGSGKTGGTLISQIFPLNPKIQMTQGIKNMQFKNVIKFKFDAIVKPISEIVLFQNQSGFVTSDAFFENTILYEMANSLGIRNTINGQGPVRRVLKNYYTISNFVKIYSLSLFLVDKLDEVNEISSKPQSNYYTFVVDLLRLIRFGTDNDNGLVNLIIYNYFVENEAIKYREGKIIIDYEKMKEANIELIKKMIIMQGDGDIDGVKRFKDKYNYVDADLSNLIKSINKGKIPTDISIEADYSIFK